MFPPTNILSWSPSVITLRNLVLAASVLVLPISAMAASTDTTTSPGQTGTTSTTEPTTTTHHKKPTHHVSHKKNKTKPATSTQS